MMMIVVGVLVAIIIILIMTGYALMHALDYEKARSDEYFKQLRKDYDSEIQKYRDEILERDKLINHYSRLCKGEN